MDITVRKATEKDIETIAKNITAMAYETSREQLDFDTVKNGVNAVFQKPDLGFYIVAEAGSRIIGSLLITYEWSDWRNGTYWWLQSVYVDPAFRRNGVYTRMHKFIEQEGTTTHGYRSLKLYTNKDNKTAQETYKRLGMKESKSLMYEK